MDEWPPGDTLPAIELTDAEQRLLEHIRAGTVDAEIAVRLGITNAEVKSRTERLAAMLGVDDREALRAPPAPPPPVAIPPGEVAASRPLRSRLLPLAVLAGLVIAFFAGLLLGSPGEEDGSPVTADAASPTAVSSTPGGSPVPAPTQPPRIEVIDGRAMEYAGRLLYSPSFPSEPVVASTSREGLTVVQLAGDGWIQLNDGGIAWSWVPNVSSLSAVRGEERIYLRLSTGSPDTRILGPSLLAQGDNLAIYNASSTSPDPILLLSAATTDGTRRYRVQVDLRGNLFIAVSPTSPGTVMEYSTGTALEMSNLLPTVRLTGGGLIGWRYTHCVQTTACFVSYHPGNDPVLAPVSGDFTCPVQGFDTPDDELGPSRPQVMSIETDRYTIFFLKVNMFPDTLEPLECPTRSDVVQGEILFPAHQFLIYAQTPEGEWLDVGVTLGGLLYIGELRTEVSCPCVGGT
jgi:hypothetical protein